MSDYSEAFSLASALDKCGFPLPQNCREMRLIVGIDQVVMVQYDVVLTIDDMAKLGDALKAAAAEALK